MSNVSKILIQAAKGGRPLITRLPRRKRKDPPVREEALGKAHATPSGIPVWKQDFLPKPEDVPVTARKRQQRAPNIADPAKRRRSCLSVSVSAEEEQLLRTFAGDRGLNFSEWARIVLFHAAGQPLPKRPERTQMSRLHPRQA